VDTYIAYNTLRGYKINHKLILRLAESLTEVSWHMYYYLMLHCRHLVMMEGLKGLLTGQGSAAA